MNQTGSAVSGVLQGRPSTSRTEAQGGPPDTRAARRLLVLIRTPGNGPQEDRSIRDLACRAPSSTTIVHKRERGQGRLGTAVLPRRRSSLAGTLRMKSYALVEYGAALRELEAPTPAPVGMEVLLEARHSRVCHTDVHLRDGYFDLGGGHQLRSNFELPHVLGHEIEGAVGAVGPDVKGIRVGSRYAAFPWIGCGRCSACRRGHENICLGVTRQLGCSSGCPGGYATHVMVPHPRY